MPRGEEAGIKSCLIRVVLISGGTISYERPSIYEESTFTGRWRDAENGWTAVRDPLHQYFVFPQPDPSCALPVTSIEQVSVFRNQGAPGGVVEHLPELAWDAWVLRIEGRQRFLPGKGVVLILLPIRRHDCLPAILG